MEIRWGKNKEKPLSSSVEEDAASTVAKARNQAHFMDEIIARHADEGGFDDLQGKGRPLSLDDNTDNYMIHKIMKNANVLPPWLELQHEIRDDLMALRAMPTDDPAAAKWLEKVNKKIKKYNHMCPSPVMQKPPVKREGIENVVRLWE